MVCAARIWPGSAGSCSADKQVSAISRAPNRRVSRISQCASGRSQFTTWVDITRRNAVVAVASATVTPGRPGFSVRLLEGLVEGVERSARGLLVTAGPAGEVGGAGQGGQQGVPAGGQAEVTGFGDVDDAGPPEPTVGGGIVHQDERPADQGPGVEVPFQQGAARPGALVVACQDPVPDRFHPGPPRAAGQPPLAGQMWQAR